MSTGEMEGRRKILLLRFQASMLVFYPEFELEPDPCPEFILVLDLSNSMRGDSVRIAKTAAILFLQLLVEKQSTVLFNVILFGTGTDAF